MRFDHLVPEVIFNEVSRQGSRPTGTLFPLNSYENRVYEVGIEDEETGKPTSLIAKFYRPGRWTAEAIDEEHRFVAALMAAEIPVVGPLALKSHLPKMTSLSKTDEGIFYTLFPKFRGREHSEILNDDRKWLGRTLARLHNVGENFVTKHRMTLTPESYGDASINFILSQKFLPPDLVQNIELHLRKAIELLRPYFKPSLKTILTHGDCHTGNILWNKDGLHLVDFDDMIVAPPVQDVWMLFNGSAEDKREQREAFFEGYETFRHFDLGTLILSEPLRTLRMIRYAAWVGQRYEEPAFQRAFPYFQERRYWEEFVQGIREQISLLQELNWS